jgi:putative acetyltransferase
MTWTIQEGELGCDDVSKLLDMHFTEMRGESPPEACHVLAIDELTEPGIRFFTLRDPAGILMCVGALKSLDPGHGEIKSMRTAPGALGLGAGGRMLRHLVETAQGMGMTRLSLETGNSPLFAAANRLYERDGFARCGPFGDYADTPFTNFYTREI